MGNLEQEMVQLLYELTNPYIWRVDSSTWEEDRFHCRVCNRNAIKGEEIQHAADCPIGKAIRFLYEKAVQ